MEFVFGLLIKIFDAVAGILFVMSFTHAENPRGTRLILLGALGLAIAGTFPGIDMWFDFIYETPVLPFTLLQAAILLFVSFFYGKCSVIRKITAPVIFVAVSYFVNSGYLYLFFSIIVNKPSSGLFLIPFTTVMVVVLAKSFMVSVLMSCVKVANYKGRYPIITRTAFVLSPVFTLFTLYLFLKILYYRVSEYRIETFIAVFGTVCVNLLIFFLFDRTLSAERENSTLQLYKNKASLERMTYAELLRMNDQLSAVKHDLRNHLLYVNKYVAEGGLGKVEEYVSSIKEMIGSVGAPVVTGNSMLDYIISSKLKDEKDIAFVASGALGFPDGMDELDIAVLMGNLLDNAIDAVSVLDKKEKLIEMNFQSFNGYRNITIRNDIITSVLENNSELVTTKEDKRSHGFGMRSVKNIVGKYDGIIECYEQDGKFCVHLAFPA